MPSLRQPGDGLDLTEHELLHPRGPEKEWYKYPALPLVLSKAGYYTYWVSNQEKQGTGIQPIPTLASTSDSTRFVRIRTAGDWNASPDSDILPAPL